MTSVAPPLIHGSTSNPAGCRSLLAWAYYSDVCQSTSHKGGSCMRLALYQYCDAVPYLCSLYLTSKRALELVDEL